MAPAVRVWKDLRWLLASERQPPLLDRRFASECLVYSVSCACFFAVSLALAIATPLPKESGSSWDT